MELLEAIEQLEPVQALKISFYVYPLVNAAHILSIGALMTSVILMDLRILGNFTVQARRPFVRLMRTVALFAFCAAALTGALMFAVRATEYVFNPAFRLKMFLILLAGTNMLVLRLFASARAGAPTEGRAASVLAVISIALWLGVLVCGRFIGFM